MQRKTKKKTKATHKKRKLIKKATLAHTHPKASISPEAAPRPPVTPVLPTEKSPLEPHKDFWLNLPEVIHDWVNAVTRVVEIQTYLCTAPFASASALMNDTMGFKSYRSILEGGIYGDTKRGRTT